MHMGTSMPPQGLLTTLPQAPSAPGVQSLNTAFAINQPTISSSHPMGAQMTQMGSYPSPLNMYNQSMQQYPMSSVSYYPTMESKYMNSMSGNQFQMNGAVQNKLSSTLDVSY
jgi:hypothetical protein